MKELPCLFLFITTVLNLMPGFLALRDVHILLPKYVRRGEDIKISCNYDLEGEALYAVKFYRGNREFYRYVPKEVPPTQAFQLSGVSVDLTLSNDHDVLLKNVSLSTEDVETATQRHVNVYKCVVAAEFPFQTITSASDMMVVVIEDDAPSVKLDRSQYHPGDPVSAECRSPASYPPANITWFLNGIQVDHERITKTEVRKDKGDPLTKSALSTISFDLPEKVSPVRINCRATVFTAYDKSSNITMIYPIPRRLTGTETLLRGTASNKSQNEHFLLCGLLFNWLFFSK